MALDDTEDLELVEFGSEGIIRCKHCRAYINPFCQFTDSGRRWRCNLCGSGNDVPSSYFCHLDENGFRRDRHSKPELSHCSVEFIAPTEYMVRTPQPPTYIFLIDVSTAAIRSGVLQTISDAIRDSLDNLPSGTRSQVGFVTYDNTVQFYNLSSNLSTPQMLVMADLGEMVLPCPDDLVVNVADSRDVIDSFLDSLPTIFTNSPVQSSESALGPALIAGMKIMEPFGGKLSIFQTSFPSLGEGVLSHRDNHQVLGTDKEHLLLSPQDNWYKMKAQECSKLYISVDQYLMNGQYADVASLTPLSKYTNGRVHFYPGFASKQDASKLYGNLVRKLTAPTGFEAVMRVRCTRGLKAIAFYGNYYIRGQDLLTLPNVNPDDVYGVDISYEETNLPAPVMTVQTALLYTSALGERRIRVHTFPIPVVQSLQECINSLNVEAITALSAKQAVEVALKTGIPTARARLHSMCVDLIRGARQALGTSEGIPEPLQLLPLYMMGLQKSIGFRGGNEIRLDERAFILQRLSTMSTREIQLFVYPRLMSLHDLGNEDGLPVREDEVDTIPSAGLFSTKVRLPSVISLSVDYLVSEGLFLLENGNDMFLWLGSQLNQSIHQAVFGMPQLNEDGEEEPSSVSILPFRNEGEEEGDESKDGVCLEDTEYGKRVAGILNGLLEEGLATSPQFYIIREGDGRAEAFFFRMMVEDRANFPGGAVTYEEYVDAVNNSSSSSSSSNTSQQHSSLQQPSSQYPQHQGHQGHQPPSQSFQQPVQMKQPIQHQHHQPPVDHNNFSSNSHQQPPIVQHQPPPMNNNTTTTSSSSMSHHQQPPPNNTPFNNQPPVYVNNSPPPTTGGTNHQFQQPPPNTTNMPPPPQPTTGFNQQYQHGGPPPPNNY